MVEGPLNPHLQAESVNWVTRSPVEKVIACQRMPVRQSRGRVVWLFKE